MIRTLALLALTLPATVHAEGARININCASANGYFTFAFSPIDTDSSGAGSVKVNGSAIVGLTGGYWGPWTWSINGKINTLLIDGSLVDEGIPMLFHTLDTNTFPQTSTLTKLTCEAPS
ncbi:hypothetical protein [Maritimibacter alkaliphilus]|uniref:hypothetical protein n=1 Tax=Maritimibacter alkaliphilus TaxID=404236 RepID=UPI0003231648|nr:hypothetical protein [Maritimibacter alkaliphilus]